MNNQIKKEIFKAYDIRGTYPDEVNEEVAFLIGQAFASFIKGESIVVGKDVRNSSNKLEKALIEGIIKQGKNVIKLGLATTPLLYFASGKLQVDGAVMITASHNPANYNGFKFCLKDAIPVGEGSGMEEIKERVLTQNFSTSYSLGKEEENNEFKKEYYQYIKSFFQKPVSSKKKKVVIDFANAMGIFDKEIYENLKDYLDCYYLFDNYDGNFPNHEANPLKVETLSFLCERVKEEKADLGIAYDGDADRIGFVDETGKVIPMDFITALLAKEILQRKPNGLILMDLRSSNAVKEFIEKAGGSVHLCRVGHSLIKKQMREEGAIFAGELSGHYFFEDNFKAEMATLAAMMILNLMNKSGRKVSELVKELNRYFHSGEINSEVKDKQEVFEKLKEKYASLGKANYLDGIRVDFEDWWFNVRMSNTEPVIRLNLEAKTKELMEKKVKEVLEVIRG